MIAEVEKLSVSHSGAAQLLITLFDPLLSWHQFWV